MNSSVGRVKYRVKLHLFPAVIYLLLLVGCQVPPPEFTLQYACLHGELRTCVAAEEFAARVADRTDGRVEIEITSIPALGISAVDVLSRMEDGTLEMAEIYAAHVTEMSDRAVLDILDLWGLYDDTETQAQVTEAIGKEIEGMIVDGSGGVVLAAQFYPSNYLFAKEPLRTAADVEGLRIYSPNRLSSEDLVTGMGAVIEEVRFATVFSALESGKLGAAISCSSCGAKLRWYDETGYLVGPIPGLGHSWITINNEKWAVLPRNIQLIIKDEAKRHGTVTKEASLNRWDRKGVQHNVSAGMEHIGLPPEFQKLMRAAALSTVLPNWVHRAGGPTSIPVIMFNEKAAPIVNVEIAEDGTAREID